ncbi:hypothetical protein CBR_g26493 [Chara braunii]|uniref:ABC transporter domain-containing protein n=1 Tax=Chara braunii TaxID=69332 RepID=A0A388L8E3_CHABU|nr:hypothetical protein CBR_g26493 [Chara braunii]|eukprot:GBG78463.1 hypothetical protein CBR_g26493 [Chara braunii]
MLRVLDLGSVAGELLPGVVYPSSPRVAREIDGSSCRQSLVVQLPRFQSDPRTRPCARANATCPSLSWATFQRQSRSVPRVRSGSAGVDRWTCAATLGRRRREEALRLRAHIPVPVGASSLDWLWNGLRGRGPDCRRLTAGHSKIRRMPDETDMSYDSVVGRDRIHRAQGKRAPRADQGPWMQAVGTARAKGSGSETVVNVMRRRRRRFEGCEQGRGRRSQAILSGVGGDPDRGVSGGGGLDVGIRNDPGPDPDADVAAGSAANKEGGGSASCHQSTTSLSTVGGECSADQRSSSTAITSTGWILWHRFLHVAKPYWNSEDKVQARLRLAAVFALTLATTGISVAFSFLGRDFYNALASKNQAQFTRQLLYYLGAFVVGIPVFVMRDYLRDRLALRWRTWMTKEYMRLYFNNRAFYKIQSQSLIDNPDQRIVDDIKRFTYTALGFSLSVFNSLIDLVSFSGILLGIYPPLFFVLIVYSLGGTAISVVLGKSLVRLNFMQEKREADFRYGLARVRENAESIAFYGGEGNEIDILLERFKLSFQNYMKLMTVSRNLNFFTSGYRCFIQLLPAAVVAPLFFMGKIEIGVITQSYSAFEHILSVFSLVVYEFQSISSFSAEVQRLGEFTEMLEQNANNANNQEKAQQMPTAAVERTEKTIDRSIINLIDLPYPGHREPTSTSFSTSAHSGLTATVSDSNSKSTSFATDMDKQGAIFLQGSENSGSLRDSDDGDGASPEPSQTLEDAPVLLEVENLTLYTPQYTQRLIADLSLTVRVGEHLLVMGPSGSGKTSLLRAIAGLWQSGAGTIRRHIAISDAQGDPQMSTMMKPGGADYHSNTTHASGTQDGAEPVLVLEKSLSQEKREDELREDVTDDRESKECGNAGGLVFFLPQRPYMVLGTLRQQLLYPTWSSILSLDEESERLQHLFSIPRKRREGSTVDGGQAQLMEAASSECPSDDDLREVLNRVMLGHLLDRADGLDSDVEWASVLSLGEQQRLAFARLLLSPARLVLMDESTSALDADNEAHLYNEVINSGITMISVGHRSSLLNYHTHLLKCVLENQDKSENVSKQWITLPIADLTMPVKMEIMQEEKAQEVPEQSTEGATNAVPGTEKESRGGGREQGV